MMSLALASKSGIVARHVAAQTMRLQSDTSPNPGHPVVTHPSFFPSLRVSSGSSHRSERAGCEPECEPLPRPHRARRAALMPGIETTDALGEKATLPAHDIVLAALQGLHNLTVGMACCQFQNELCPLGIIAASTASHGLIFVPPNQVF